MPSLKRKEDEMTKAKALFQGGDSDLASQNAPQVASADADLEKIGTLLGDAYDRLERAAEEAEEKGGVGDAALLREAAALVIEAARLATVVHGRPA
jgi:hypothetical protein